MVLVLLSVLILLVGKNDYIVTSTAHPTVVWWTPLTLDYAKTKTCGLQTCVFTDVRGHSNALQAQAYLFYGSNFNYTDLPLPRNENQIWGLLHEESPKNVPYLQNEDILKYFNYTSTFSRYSDLPLTLQYLKNFDMLIDTKYFISTEKKNHLKLKNKLASVAYLQSHCDALSGRDEYIKELMEFIDIDSYGACLNNRRLPDSLKEDYLTTLDSDELHHFLSKYKFLIAFENAACNDYITEKFWRPILLGSIPIVFGSDTIEDWLPNQKSAILIKDFASPKLLAEYIKYLDKNDTAYNKYLSHKLLGRAGVTNKRLIQHINDWTGRSEEGLFHDFECYVCENLHNSNRKFATGRHYHCGNELVLPQMKTNMNNFYWHDIVKTGQFTAKALSDLIQLNKSFTEADLATKVKQAMLDAI